MRKLLVFTLILFTALSAFGQGGIPLKTGKKYVTAILEYGSGWVQVKINPGKVTDGTLSSFQKSFVSFDINGTVFTNNDVGLPLPLQANTVIIKDGIISKIPGKLLNTDTLRCIWQDKNGVDIIQEIYPVLLDRSEQVVLRWKAINKTSDTVVVAAQYLLDIRVGDDTFYDARTLILTRYGFRRNWDVFTPSTGIGIPRLYASFQYHFPSSLTFGPGLTAMGLTDNTYANIGLTTPIRQTIGDWNVLAEQRWGPPAVIPIKNHDDAATLLEFSPCVVPPNQEVLLGATSYGTGEFSICTGNLSGVGVYPPRVNFDSSGLYTNPFTIEMYVFNPNYGIEAPNTSIMLSVGPHLTILSPTPITNNGKRQVQMVEPSGYIAPLVSGYASWSVLASTSVPCSNDIVSSLRFVGESPEIGYPIFINSVEVSDTCEHPIIIECASLTSVESKGTDAVMFLILGNPTSDKATIQLKLEKTQDVKLRIVDVVGREVRTLDAKGLSQGENLISLQTSELASGTYYVVVEIDGKQFAKSLKVVR
jgi:hypothetical protein